MARIGADNVVDNRQGGNTGGQIGFGMEGDSTADMPNLRGRPSL